MTVSQEVKIWLVTTLVFVLLDMLWLGKIIGPIYSQKLGYLGELKNGRISFNLLVGLLTQIIIATGLAVILMETAGAGRPLGKSVLTGLFVGFVIYAAYDLTNLSFIKGWPLDITIIDILWGSFQGGVAGAVVWIMMKSIVIK